MNILSYVVAFPATTARKNVLRDSDRSYTTQPVQICELAFYDLEQKKKKKKKKKREKKHTHTHTHTQQNHTYSFENYQVLQP